MFFWASKIFWVFAEPANLLVFALIVGVIGLRTSRARAARRLLVATAVISALCAFGPVGALLTRPLEDRFARPGADMPAPDGVIVLGGAMNELINDARGVLMLDEFGSRMTEGVALARRFPDARLIFTGGSASLALHERTEADDARGLFEALGVPRDRLIAEDRSRNTYENAIFTRDLIHPRPDERFLLVTSGFHMPRAMGVFRRAGFNVIPWPADYLTRGDASDYWRPRQSASDSLRAISISTKEWIGLVAYRLAGMTDALLPAP